ncbi:MAG TPA: DEAD/DEAH box helicase family protein [Pyrinomonadaceae bacterium]|nr:DEAD/DEAH box helicase family protein [Pyrinomonadaceae bacterium]
MDKEPFKDYLTVLQAARFLGVSAQTLRRWDAEGKLKSVRHPGNDYRYYKRSDLEPLRLDYNRAKQLNPGEFFEKSIADIEANDRLREPQRAAHKATREHFERSRDPAIVQIPVGCGKTGIIATLPFGVSVGRVLIIAPNTTIRKGIAEALEVGNPKFFLGKTKVLSSFSDGPFAAVLDGPDANIHDCTESQYVVTNIQQLASSADRWLPQFPPNFFDMILVDEGHHNVAESWRKVFERFPGAKVVSLTATPFRSDGQSLTGEVVYRYPYAKAMLAGYIKQIHSINVAPAEIYFTYKGDAKRHTLAEVLELREEAWFRKGVALAPECNIHIVEASIQRMRELRANTGQKQQIIAAACSIDHARQIRVLYEQRGLKVREIYSEMDADKQRSALQQLEDLQIDCIVQVQMLGEGFDHPPLSVAAVFRPFRSLSPYVQFVGRIMRVMFQDDPINPANHGYVVSHVGLNNDSNWRDFREFDLEDQQVFRDWLEAKPSETEGDETKSGGNPRRFDEDMLVHGELLSDFVKQSFLDPDDDRIVDRILDAVIPGVGVPFRDFMTRDQTKAMLKKAQEKMLAVSPQPIPISPQQRRRGARKRLADRPKSVAARVLKDLKLAPGGFDVSKLISDAKGSPNLIAVTRLVHKAIDKNLGIGKNERNKPSAPEAETTVEDLDRIGDEVRDRIKQAREPAK